MQLPLVSSSSRTPASSSVFCSPTESSPKFCVPPIANNVGSRSPFSWTAPPSGSAAFPMADRQGQSSSSFLLRRSAADHHLETREQQLRRIQRGDPTVDGGEGRGPPWGGWGLAAAKVVRCAQIVAMGGGAEWGRRRREKIGDDIEEKKRESREKNGIIRTGNPSTRKREKAKEQSDGRETVCGFVCEWRRVSLCFLSRSEWESFPGESSFKSN